ncbi:host specificity factor TipJ family phage tail protein [Vibrio cholerae]
MASGQTLNQWMSANIKGFYACDTPPFSYFVNAKQLSAANWDDYTWSDEDFIELVAEPKDPITAVMAVVAVVSAGMAIYAMNQFPDTFQKTTPEGSPIYSANTQGNQPRLMGIIPELFGRHKTYPDIISEPHWYFSGDDEFLLMMTSIGVGEYDIRLDDIIIGDTPISKYGVDIDAQIFAPGASVTVHPAHQNMYTSREVGATASTAGIELKGAINSITPEQTRTSGSTLSLVNTIDGFLTEFWPIEWEVHDVIAISGTPGGKSVTESHAYGGWRGEANADILNYWAKDDSLHDCRVGDYVNYPTGGSNWERGVILSKFGGIHNGVEFNAVRVGSATGAQLPVSAVPSSLRNEAIRFEGRDDGRYKVKSITGNRATVKRLYPSGGSEQSWGGFSVSGNQTNWRITAEETLPGQPAGPYFACPASETTDQIAVDIKYPDGIGYMNDDGSISERQIRIMIEWRGEGESHWNQVPFSRSAGTRDQLGNTITIPLGRRCRPEVRVYRVTGDDQDSRAFDRVEFKRLKARLTPNTRYNEFTTLAVRIRGSNSLSRSAENKLCVIATRKLPIPNGKGGWTTERYPTRDIAPAVRYIITDAGLSDFQIGHHELLRLHDVWKKRGDVFDAVFTDASTLFDVLKKVMAVGYAEPTLNYGQIVPVRDEPRSVFDYQYQPDNMLGKGLERSGKFFDEEEPDGIEVEYFSTETWKPETIMCLLPGDNGINPEKVRAFGVTDKNRAWRFGMRVRRKKRYRRFQYSFQTEMDAFNSNYLDYVALADDVPGYAQSGRLEGYSYQKGKTILNVDMPLEWGDGVHHIALRKPNGRTSGPYVCQPGVNPYQLTIVGSLDFSPVMDGSMEPPLWLFGAADSWCYPALIDDITPQGTEKCSVKAVNYDVRVYADDDNVPDEYGYPKNKAPN